ncbi:hypothetical protein [Pasteurella bettyae]|uniref:hypothetical protein n=1 Tax=Pasteurella bettyae TaxID=752 RepID=UPI003D26B897
MKYLLLGLATIHLSGCIIYSSHSDQPKSICNFSAIEQGTLDTTEEINETRNLIIFYDPAIAPVESLIQQANKLNCKVVYKYQNFAAITIYVPENANIQVIKKHFENLEQVLQVNEDQLNQFNNAQ